MSYDIDSQPYSPRINWVLKTDFGDFASNSESEANP